eukprot:403343855
MQHKPHQISISSAQTSRAQAKNSISLQSSQQSNLKSKSKPRNKLNTQPSISHVSQVIQLDNYLRRQSIDKSHNEKSLDKRSLSKSNRNEKSQSKDKSYLSKVQKNSVVSNQLVKPVATIVRSNKTQVKVNPQLLKPVLQTAHLPPQLHFKKKKDQNTVQSQVLNTSDNLNSSTCKSYRNHSRNQPIKSLKKLKNLSNSKDLQTCTINSGQQTNHNISILSNNFVGSYNHSYKQSWQMNNNNSTVNQISQMQTLDSRNHDNITIENQEQAKNFLLNNLNEPQSPLIKEKFLGNTTQKNHHQRLLSEDSYNGCRSCEKYPHEKFYNNQSDHPGYMIIDLQQSNEKSSVGNINQKQRAISHFNADNLIKSEFNDNFGNNQQTQMSDMNFQSLDFRTLENLTYQQKERRRRRDLCLSQSSQFMQNLVLKVKSVMSKSVNREKLQVYQTQKENKEQLSQNETRIKSKDLMKRNSENRLELLKSQMKRSLVEYKRSKERLQQQKITPIKDNCEIRKVSAFAQSVLSFSSKIDKLISVQKTGRVPFQEQNDQNEKLSNQRKISLNSKNSKIKYQTKIERENLDNYKKSAQNQYAKLKENKTHQRGFSQGKQLINPRLLEQKTRNAMPSYVKRTYLEMSSDSSTLSNKSEHQSNQNKNMAVTLDLPLNKA